MSEPESNPGPEPESGSERGSGPADTPDQQELLTFILPGGKVDPAAIRAYFDANPSTAEGGDPDVDDRPAIRFELQRDHQTRLDKYLTSRITFMSRTQIQSLIEDGFATVNGKAAKPSTKLRLGDAIEIRPPRPHSGEVVPEEIPLVVLFEDRHLIVLNKDPDIIVHPARTENSGTMINALAWHFANRSDGALSEVGKEFARPGVVHRLDRNTSGCIVFAKDDESHWKIGAQFEHRSVDKRYLAVVQGRVEPDIQVIDLPLGPHQSKQKGYREKQVVRFDDLGKASITICRVRERYRLHERHVAQQHYTLVELELKTGRTHQIRVHLSHLGYPIVGDDMYGGSTFQADESSPVLERQALHAALLAFAHPITGEALVFTAPPRPELADLIASLRTGETTPVHSEGTVPLTRFGL
ncbi:MAG: 23S rRNA pseudouridine1911/1915/1917 synthase [Phycisphaerales bacterium]